MIDLKPYAARGGAGTALHLDANESPWAPPPGKGTESYNLYPGQQPPILRQRLADLYGVQPSQVMMGRGADEAIEVLLRTFCEAGADGILTCPPTFGYFAASAAIQGAKVVEAPLTAEFDYDANLVRARMVEAGVSLKIVFLCSPNNPTGTLVEPSLVFELCREFPETLIVVDEAYAEFSTQESFAGRIGEYPNLVVLRTLSKAYGLAGVRMGVAIADPRVIELMCKVLPPYPIPRPVERVVLQALAPEAMPVHEARLVLWKTERARMQEALQASPFVRKVYPSEANFLLLEVCDDENLLQTLARFQVQIRDFRHLDAGRFRISIGSPEQNDIALAAFGVEQSPPVTQRIAEAFRSTKETRIAARVNLDDATDISIETGIGFFDHMLEALAKHGGFGLVLSCLGDLEVDAHHTVEDCALVLGESMAEALGDKAGIGRFGFVLPMDEAQAHVVIDLSGRPAHVFTGAFPTDHVGAFPAQMCPHFFESLAQTLGAAIQISVKGDNTHHMIEACFKGFGRALAPAIQRSGTQIPSTKGVL
jgi:histidinol-phosphate aminotransferase/imidazoleglycerol-phosphate dehydratase/histidinol-phosphatase